MLCDLGFRNEESRYFWSNRNTRMFPGISILMIQSIKRDFTIISRNVRSIILLGKKAIWRFCRSCVMWISSQRNSCTLHYIESIRWQAEEKSAITGMWETIQEIQSLKAENKRNAIRVTGESSMLFVSW